MADPNICKDRELDFFLIESCAIGDRNALLGMGFDAYIRFHSDGTVEWLEMYMPMTGTWADGVITVTVEGETRTRKYTIDGDVLTIIDEDGNGCDSLYRRSDYETYDSSASAPPGAGETVEIPVTDGFRNGCLSAVCSDGWSGSREPSTGMISFSCTDPDTPKGIYVKYDIRECAVLEGEKIDEMTEPESGRVWERAYIAEYDQMQVLTYMDGSAIKVTASGLDFSAEEDQEAIGIIIFTSNLSWETEESGLSVCEGKESDFFELRSMTTESSTGNRALLTQFGYDWCILFRGDGTVTAKFDRAVTCHWGDGFGHVVNGRWADGAMTFIDGDKQGVLAYTLEGDRMTVAFRDGLPVVFQRSAAAPPDFDALK